MIGSFFTSESVSQGHPDKICDQISDCLLDLFLAKDCKSRVAIEVMVTTNRVILAGEVKSKATVCEEEIFAKVKDVIKNIGYDQHGFSWKTIEIQNYIHEQSPDIARGVDGKKDNIIGAGDQGIMFGYAVNENKEYMPSSLRLSHKLMRLLAQKRHNGELPQLLPDSKCQFTLEYNGVKPVGIYSVILSTQHKEEISQQDLKELLIPVIKEAVSENLSLCSSDMIFVNPAGPFVIGGPDGDCGLTGRKIIVDTYGGAAPHGGGAFSGKDPSKVDRSAAYMARYLAKNIVHSGLASKCLIQLAYAIGMSQPIAIYLDCYETNKCSLDEIIKVIKNTVDLSPQGIINLLKLENPIYFPTATYGHFGRSQYDKSYFTWENCDLAEEIFSKLV